MQTRASCTTYGKARDRHSGRAPSSFGRWPPGYEADERNDSETGLLRRAPSAWMCQGHNMPPRCVLHLGFAREVEAADLIAPAMTFPLNPVFLQLTVPNALGMIHFLGVQSITLTLQLIAETAPQCARLASEGRQYVVALRYDTDSILTRALQ